MSYLQRSKRPGEKAGWYASIGVIVFLLLFGIIFPNASRSAVQSIVAPFWKKGNAIETYLGDRFSVFYFKRSLVDQNAALSAEVESLQGQMLNYQQLQAENDALNVELGRKPKGDSHVAAVVLRPPELPYDTFILDAGSDTGIAVGDAVVAGDGVFIGTITEVYGRSSKAVLASSSGIETKASVGGSPVTFVGKGGGNYEASVPQNISIAAGDAIPVFKSAWTLADASSVTVDPNNSFQQVLARAPVNFSELRYAFIVHPSI